MEKPAVLEWKSLLSRLFLWGYCMVLLVPIAVRIPLPLNAATLGGIAVLGLLMSIVLLEIFGRLYDSCPLKTSFRDDSKYHWMGVGIFLVTLAVFTFYWWQQWPGGFSSDNADQMTEVYVNSYTNWHPALHTFLYFAIPMKLGADYGTIVWLQLLYFSAAFGYLVKVLAYRDMPKVLVLLLCGYVWVNPYMATFTMYPWKDTAMMTFALLLMGYYVQIFCSKGAWLYKWKNIIALAAVTVLCCYMRHNAILFAAPLVVFALWFARKRKGAPAKVLAVALACVLLVQGTYKVMDVQKPDDRIVETVGLPVTIWCNVMQKNPEALPEETRAVFLEIAPQETYDNVYRLGSFNSMKWDPTTNLDRIDAMSYGEVLGYTLDCLRHAPFAAVEGAAMLTHLVWSVEGDTQPMETAIMGNDWGIEARERGAVMQWVLDWCENSGLTRIVFGSLGLWNLMLIAAALVLFMRNKAGVMHAIPVLCYNYGTMLLLSGRDYRFFLYTLPLWLPTIFMMYLDKREIFPVKN